jgi:hypothetical protein
MSHDDLWIDFIEDELDPSLREDMQRLLARQNDTCTRYETLRGALEDQVDARAERDMLANCDFDALHAKIMAQIPDDVDAPPRRSSARTSSHSKLRRLSAKARNVVIPSVMGALLVLSFVLHHVFQPSMLEAREVDFSEHLVASSNIGALVEGHSMLGQDLAQAAASAKLERMNDREARALARRLTL